MKIAPNSIEFTQVTQWNDGRVAEVADSLVIEEPLEIRVDGIALTVCMRTPGHDLELAAGLLLSEGVIDGFPQITNIVSTTEGSSGKANIVQVNLQEPIVDRERFHRSFTAASGCGVCGRASIDSIRLRNLPLPIAGFTVNPEILCELPEKLRSSQEIFGRTGGLHAAALFTSRGELLVSREDIGRHNAVDKIIGWALFQGRLPLSETVLMVSGRGGFEVIQKAITAGIPVLASVSAPSSLAVRLARELGLTLVGFLRGRRFVVYSGGFRCIPQQT